MLILQTSWAAAAGAPGIGVMGVGISYVDKASEAEIAQEHT